MIEIIFKIVLALNVVIALTSLAFAYILLRREGDKVYFNFGMSTLFVGLWATVTLIDFYRLTPFSSSFHGQLGFLTGLWILHFFLLFSYYFSFSTLSFFKKTIIYFGSFVVSAMTMWPMFLIRTASVDFPFRYRSVSELPLTIYNVYFLLLAFLAFRNLFKRFIDSDGIRRIQLKKIILGTFVAVIANLIFSLVNFYYQEFDLTHLGMIFTYTVIFYIYSILYKARA